MAKVVHKKPEPRIYQYGSVADLQVPEELFVKAFDANPYPQTITRFENGRYLCVNDSFVEATGYQRDEVIGHTSLELGILADKPDRQWLTRALDEQGRVDKEKVRFRIKRGEVRTGLLSAEIIKVGGEHCILSLVSDVTAHLEVEERLRQHALMLDVVQDSVVALDAQRRITYWNHAAEQLFGWSATEALGQDAQKLLFTETQAVFDEAWRGVQRSGTWHGEVLQRARDGSDHIVASRWLGIRHESSESTVRQPRGRAGNDEFSSLLIVSTDIAEQKRLTAELVRSARLARIGRLAAGLAHEIKNPLAGIKGVADAFLENRQLTRLEQEWMEGVRHQVANIDARVRGLLDLARPRAFHIKLSSLTEVLRTVVLLAQHHAAVVMETQGHKISVEFLEAAGEPLLLPIDAAEIEEAVFNLVLNAIESIHGSGRVTVRVRRRHRRKEARRRKQRDSEAVIEVIDTGKGIEVENRARIFDPFFTTKRDGTGLGLPAVRWTANAYGGGVTFRTTIGRGSVFILTIPLEAPFPDH